MRQTTKKILMVLRANGILDEGDGCGPDIKAGDLALLLARARATGEHVAGG